MDIIRLTLIMLYRDCRGMCYPQLSGFAGGVLFGRIMMFRSRPGPGSVVYETCGSPVPSSVGGKK